MIVIGGENLIDMVEAGRKQGKTLYSANPGGSPYNVAIATARQGEDVGYLTPVSSDRLGDLLAQRLEASGVTILAERIKNPSSLAVVSLIAEQPTYAFYREGTADRQVSAESLGANMPEGTKVFHIGSLALCGEADAPHWEAAYDAAVAAGVFASLDPNVRPAFIDDPAICHARIERMAAKAGVLKLSDEDLDWLYPGASHEEGLRKLAQSGGQTLAVVTRGGAGALALIGDTVIEVPAGRADPLVDTVGAGDTFMASLIAGLSAAGKAHPGATLTPDEARTILERAAKAAALNCQMEGCDPPYLADL